MNRRNPLPTDRTLTGLAQIGPGQEVRSPSPVDRQAGVRTLPSRILRVQAVKTVSIVVYRSCTGSAVTENGLVLNIYLNRS